MSDAVRRAVSLGCAVASGRVDSRAGYGRPGLAVGPSRVASRRPDPDVYDPRTRAARRRLVRYLPGGWPKMTALGQSLSANRSRPSRASEKHGEARVAKCCERTS